jgi:hypothetical protein
MIVVCAQWQSELMTILQGDFEEELRRMSLDRGFDPRKLRDSCAPCEAILPEEHELLRRRYFGRSARRS